METCPRKYIESNGYGFSQKVVCGKEIFQDGLCKHHYKRAKAKLVPWGERPGYIPASAEDLERGRSLKKKDSHVHNIYRLRKGVIQRLNKFEQWEDTDLQPDYKLFCVKKF